MRSRVVSVIPTLDTGSAFADGDQMSDVFTIGAIDNGTAKIVSLAIIDKAKVSVNLQVLFFNASPTVTSVKNAALDIADSEMAAKCLGSVAVSSYTALNTNSVATVLESACGLKVQTNGKLFGILLCKGAAGSAFAAGDLIVKIGMELDH